MTRTFILASAFAIVCALPLHAQNNPYVPNGSIGSTSPAMSPYATPTSDAARPFRTIQPLDWVGKRFIFLPAPRETRQYAYSDFHPNLDYTKYVGRIAKVESITGPDFGRSDEPSSVHLVLEDNGERVQTNCICPKAQVTLGGLGLLDDIDQAKQKYVGQTMWLARLASSLEVYDAASDQTHTIDVKKYQKVVVKDVIAGGSNLTPVRLVLRTPEGTEGYVDVNMSNTNPGVTTHQFHFEDKFMTVDPKKNWKYTDKVWDAIERGEVGTGMSPDQVKLAWGDPETINNLGQNMEWHYNSGSVIRFANGVVKSVGN
jgi:hypothetical protein